MIELILPWPVSANRYWRTYMPRGFKAPVTTLSAEAKSYKIEVRRIAFEAGVRRPLAGRVRVDIDLYPQRPQDWVKRARADPAAWDDDVRCIDLDNARKVLYDAMCGVVFVDDKFVFEDSGRRCEPDGAGRVVVRVRQIECQQDPNFSLELPPPQHWHTGTHLACGDSIGLCPPKISSEPAR